MAYIFGTENAVKRNLKVNYESACNAYLCELLKMWELSAHDGYWIADDVGTSYYHDANIYINMEEIIFCVENNVSLGKFMEYTDYCLLCHEYNFNIPNLKSYISGCPIVPQETFDKLDALKKQLNDCIDETKEKF